MIPDADEVDRLASEVVALRDRVARAEDELARQRALYAHAYDGIVTASAEVPYTIVDLNPRALRMLGVADGELRGKPLDTLAVAADRARLTALAERSLTGVGASGVVRLRPPGGLPLPVRFAVVEVAIGDGRSLLVCAVSSLESLSDGTPEEWMRRAVEGLPLGLLLLDELDRPQDWNAAAAALAPGTISGSLLVAWSDWPDLPDAVAAARRGELVTLRGTIVPEGATPMELEVTVFPVYDANGAISRVGLLIEDRSVEAELRNQRRLLERRLQAIFDAIGDAVVVTDARGRVDGWNPGAEQLYGWTREEAMGRDFGELVEERTQVDMGGRSTLEMVAGHTWVGRVAHRDRDGRSRELDVVVRGLIGPSGALEGRVAVCRPSSLAGELHARLLRAERLQALESLAGGMAHEFNNLLGVILGNAGFLAAHVQDPELSRAIEESAEAARRGAGLTQRLSTFARRAPAPGAGPADVVAAARAVKALLATEGRRGLTVEVDAGEPVYVDAEATELERALLNLALNARDAMGGSGVIRIAILARAVTGVVDVVVDDSGPGVPAELRRQIFDPFFTTKPPGQGIGLGLAVVHGLVVGQWGGQIDVSDAPSGGARFVIRLPLRTEAEGRAAPARPVRRVLVVDDDPAVRAATARLFRLLGAEPHVASSAEEARAALLGGVAPELVVLDVVMPGTSGDELYRELRERHSDVPVLFVSGYPAGKLEAILAADERTGFLAKPFDRSALAAELQRLLAWG